MNPATVSRRSSWRMRLGWVAPVAACLLIGCGGGDEEPQPKAGKPTQPGPPTVRFAPVSGTVTVDGKPLTEGFIQFIPTGPAGGPISTAEIRDGKFKDVSTDVEPSTAGAVVGPVAILVEVPENAEVQVADVYAKKETTPLEETVAEGGSTLDLKLQGKQATAPPTLSNITTIRDRGKIIELVRVSGTVTIDGVPLASGQIMLVPKHPTRGPMATGTIVDGKFDQLTSYRRYPGAGTVVGYHKVGIQPGRGGGTAIPSKWQDYITSPLTVRIMKLSPPLKIEISTRDGG